ncbi:MAG TPA: histidine kinase N-terminal 7TM domain-containing protein, partial [Kiritimatiellia bacterium]|nr:histidine kinase N-terminal 7TM domain-containing protein [Kiritimatiellia bacterium]
MNFFQSAILVALITNFVFGIVVISIKFHRRQNQGFFLLTMVLGAWLLALFMAAFASSNEHLMFWIKQSSASSALIPVALNLLRLSLVERDQGWVRLMIRARWWLAAYPVILFICQTPWFLRSAELPIPGQAVATPDYGPGFIVFTGYLAVTVVMLLVHYVRDIRQSSGIQKVELQFVLIGLIFGFLVGVLLVIIPNVTGVVELGQLLPLPVFAADSILAYGIATRNIMDVSAFLRRVISNLLLVVYLVTIYLIIYILSKTLLPVWLLDRVPAAHVLAALGMAFLLSPSYFQLNQVLGRVFVGISNQDVADVIKRSSKEMVTATTSRELVRAVSGMLESLLHPTSVYILYREDHRLTQILPSNQTEGSILSLRLEEPLANALEQEQKILNRDLFARFEKSDSLNQIERSMDDLGVVVAAGIYSKNRMEGAILLGPRTTGQIYGSIEVQAIESVCGQLAVSLENAKLYTEVQNS